MILLNLGPLSNSIHAHEFWIEPESYHVPFAKPIKASLKNGQNFSGGKLVFLSHTTKDSAVVTQSGRANYVGQDGDQPAFQVDQPTPGLNILTFFSEPTNLVFREWDKFTSYLNFEGLDWAAQSHLDAGLPKTNFSERYSRCAKSLVQVGKNTDGQDQATGMPFELVALTSPYGAETRANGGVLVSLLWQGMPMPDQQINMFHKSYSSNTALKTHVKTDAKGQAFIPFKDGEMVLLNSVRLDLTGEKTGAVWESYWASMTFGS